MRFIGLLVENSLRTSGELSQDPNHALDLGVGGEEHRTWLGWGGKEPPSKSVDSAPVAVDGHVWGAPCGLILAKYTTYTTLLSNYCQLVAGMWPARMAKFRSRQCRPALPGPFPDKGFSWPVPDQRSPGAPGLPCSDICDCPCRDGSGTLGWLALHLSLGALARPYFEFQRTSW